MLNAVAELMILVSLLTSTVQPTGPCLLVTVDEDVVENILFLSDLVQELPDASLSGVTNVAALRTVPICCRNILTAKHTSRWLNNPHLHTHEGADFGIPR